MMVVIIVLGISYVAVVGWKISNVMDKFDDSYNETGIPKKEIYAEVKNERRRKKIKSIFTRKV